MTVQLITIVQKIIGIQYQTYPISNKTIIYQKIFGESLTNSNENHKILSSFKICNLYLYFSFKSNHFKKFYYLI